jgi:hypothetical protein
VCFGRAGGDFNLDGSVDVTDLGILATHFNQGGGGAPSLSFAQATASFPNLATVPEPATFGLLMLCGLGFLGRRRQHRS